jgi:hypothetical protein
MVHGFIPLLLKQGIVLYPVGSFKCLENIKIKNREIRISFSSLKTYP